VREPGGEEESEDGDGVPSDGGGGRGALRVTHPMWIVSRSKETWVST
jgi:hypothetical protein